MWALQDICLRIEKGAFVCLVGPSGCGKTTLLHIIAGLVPDYQGQVIFQGQEIKGAGQDRMVIFQESSLFPWLTVSENVTFGLRMAGMTARECRQAAIRYLKAVHLEDCGDCYIHQLSGGMKQRVEFARALSFDSEILLMDEPFAALDCQLRRALQLELVELWKKTSKTVLFVTHDLEEALLLGETVVVLSSQPGRIKKVIEIGVPFSERNDRGLMQPLVRELSQELNEEAV